MSYIISLLICLLVAYVICEAIFTAWVIVPDRKAAGQPGLGDILKMRRVKLELNSSEKMDRYQIRSAVKIGGWAELDREIRKRFPGDYTDWSIDYVHAHYNANGERRSGGWRNKDAVSQSVIFFYKRQKPVIPKPKTKPVPRPQTADMDEERMRLEAFVKHPSAFWLNPDWQKSRETGQPFWMHDPAPIPSRYLPVPEKIERLAELLAERNYRELALQRINSPVAGTMYVILNDDGFEEVKLSSAEYRQAKRRALEMEGAFKW
jgi:hypothetical protein